MWVKMYDQCLAWAEHRYASRYLAILSFLEASFFPIPPDVMLAPMVLANRKHAFRYALLATLFSVFGGMLGYVIGFYAFHTLALPFIDVFGYQQAYQKVLGWFNNWGFWSVLLAGITPIPYKLFTICSGVMQFPFSAFLIASFIGRAARFYLVAAVIHFGGPNMQNTLRRFVEQFAWKLSSIVIGLFLLWFYFS